MLYGFSHISKTGGTTLLTILRSTFGIGHCDIEPWIGKHHSIAFTPDDLAKVMKVHPRLRSVNGHHFHPYHDYENVTPIKYFTFIRNPLSRCLSEYQYQTTQRDKNWDFNEYIIGAGSDAQSKFICGEANAEAAIEIIRKKNIFCGLTEHFNESLLLVNRLVFDNQLNCFYQRQKSAPSQSVRDSIYNNDKAIQLINEHNKHDIALYKFVKDELYPEQIKEYGATLKSDLASFQEALDHHGFNNFNIAKNRAYRNLIYKPSIALFRTFNKSI